MISRSVLLTLAAILALCLVAFALAAQAGYLNLFSGSKPYLWKSRYDRMLEIESNLTGRIDAMQRDLVASGERADELEQQVKELEVKIDELTAESRQLTSQRQNLSIELAQLRQQYDSRNESCVLAEAQLENVTTLLAVADTRLDEIEGARTLQGEIFRTYEWFYISERSWRKGVSGTRGTGFNRSEYISLATSRHVTDDDTDEYALIWDREVADIDELADHLYSQGSTDVQRANNILKFVQSLPYIHDSESDNYVRHPLETLIEGGGDCEDTSVLAAKLLSKAGPEGYPVILLTVDTDRDDEVDHMMIAVDIEGGTGMTFNLDGRDYFVGETTSRYYVLGQLPSGYVIVEAVRI